MIPEFPISFHFNAYRTDKIIKGTASLISNQQTTDIIPLFLLGNSVSHYYFSIMFFIALRKYSSILTHKSG